MEKMAPTSINDATILKTGGGTTTTETALGLHPGDDITPTAVNEIAKVASGDPRPGCVTRGRGIRPGRGGSEGRGGNNARWTTQFEKKMGGPGRGSSKVPSGKKGASASAGQRSKKAAAFAAKKVAADEKKAKVNNEKARKAKAKFVTEKGKLEKQLKAFEDARTKANATNAVAEASGVKIGIDALGRERRD